MSDQLFPLPKSKDYLIDLEYHGPSFDGVMEISQLKYQLSGLEDAITIIAQVLARQRRIDFNPNDIQILIEAFERGSFKDRARVVLRSLRSLNQYQGAMALGVLLLEVIRMIPIYQPADLRSMPPQVVSEIGDQVKVELFKNEEFLKSVANLVRPLEQTGDRLTCIVPEKNEVAINYENKENFLQLAGESKPKELIEGDKFETLHGRINRVDLDATRRHIGFKVNSEGSSIPATLIEQLRSPQDMRNLLGQWVKLEGTTTYQGGIRTHITISKYQILKQSELFKEDLSQ